MLRLLAILLVLVGLVCGAVVWSGADSGSGSRADFTFINRGDNKSLDPNTMSWMQDIRLAESLWEGLYTFDPKTLKPVLGCADRAEVDPATHTVWTFHIRPDARWSNGDPVLARDFLFAWRRFLETPAEYTHLHYYIRGAREYEQAFERYVDDREAGRPAMPPDFSSVGEVALDDRTLRVTLTDPLPFFPSLCAFVPFFPMNESSMSRFASTDPVTGVVHYDPAFTRPPNLVTNGPYRLAEWTFKRRLRMMASNFYWDRAHVRSRVIDQVYADDALAAYRAYDRGDVDWLSTVEPDIASVLRRQGRPDLHIFTAFGTYFYDLNCQPRLANGRTNPLVDVRVRQALAMSIDKQPIVQDVGQLGQPIATDLVPPGVFPHYVSPPGLTLNVAAARQLLAEAGYPNGRGFPRLTILYNGEEQQHGDIAQIMSRQWQQNLNIPIDMESVEVKVFAQRLHTQQYEIARAGWYGDYDDPSTFTDIFQSESDDNDPKWSNPRYDQLCAQARREANPLRRLQLLSQAESILLNDAPIIPIYTYVSCYMFRSNVHGIELSPNDTVMFKSVYVQR